MNAPDTAGPTLSRRRFLSATAATASAVSLGGVLAGCEGGNSTQGGANSARARTAVFEFVSRIESPKLLNPLAPGVRDDNGLQAAMIESLFVLNYETGEIEPWLGESFTSNKTLDVWTLKLRDGVTWSDGEVFDIDDFIFTINYLKDGPADINFGHAIAMKQWVKDANKIDKLTAEVRLTGPNPRFQLDWFACKIYRCVVILPEHIWHDKDPLKFTNYDPAKGWPVFTGPYKLKSAQPDRFVWERDQNWWGAKTGFKPLPAPHQLQWLLTENEDVRVQRAANNEFDALEDITTGAYQSLHSRNKNFVAWDADQPYSWADPCTRLFSLNNAIEPWNDREMRWAVNYAISKDDIIRIAYEGSTTKAKIFYPPYKLLNEYVDLLDRDGLFEEYPILKYDPDRAQEIIESKGYKRKGSGAYQKDGKQLSLLIDTDSDTTELSRYADVIAANLNKVGIAATVRKSTFTTWSSNMALGKFEAVTDFFACGSVSEPWYSMNLYHERYVVPVGKSSESNGVRWKNAAYSKSVDAMANLPLGDKRIEKPFIEAAREYLHDLPFLPAAAAKKLYTHNTTYWTGWPTTEDRYIHPPKVWNSSHIIIHNLRPAKKA